MKHCYNMANKKIIFGHHDYDIRTLLIREKHKLPCAENIAKLKFDSDVNILAENCVNYWIEFNPENIGGNFKFNAVAVFYVENEDDFYFTQLFAS